MLASVNAVPQPLPGKTQPAPKPQLDWVAKDLVEADVEFRKDGLPKRQTLTYQAMGLGAVSRAGTEEGPTDVRAFSELPHTSFVDAVEAASQIAVRHPLHLNVDRRDATEQTASLAIALLQAANGAWFTTSLAGNQGSLTVDTGRNNITIHEVTRLHPDVKAVVGAHSWVNFTDEQIEPKLATTES